jgi:DNA modification methylase
MTTELTVHLKTYIQPFERRLALQELAALAKAKLTPLDSNSADAEVFSVVTDVSTDYLVQKLAYWEVVVADEPRYTEQVQFEATTSVVKNGISLESIRAQLPFKGPPPLPNRRCLRYGTHGIHEYRGKFFPQLVRSLVNVGAVSPGGWVADPMCGSGTTIVEAVTSGHKCLGADINPLSVRMARAKTQLLGVDCSLLVAAFDKIREKLLGDTSASRELVYFRTLSSADQKYLQKWFSAQVLEDLDRIAVEIGLCKAPLVRELFWLSLSNIIRSVSWQKVDDLRVRKESRLPASIDPVREFLEELGKSVRTLLAFRYQFGTRKLPTFSVNEADARCAASCWSAYAKKIDLVVTSPPYATALPYLDTDRLSLSYLGLLARTEHRAKDQEMIGNREVSERLRRDYWSLFAVSGNQLPQSITDLISRIRRLNRDVDVGFRRKNLPALLAKYFFDMRQVLENLQLLLKQGARAYVVVGDNSTTAGDTKVNIATSDLLTELAESLGYEIGESIPMEMLSSRDIFRRNTMPSERIIQLITL